MTVRLRGHAFAWRRCWLFVALVVVAPCHALDRHYTAIAYDEASAQVRYREEHWLFEEAGVQRRLVVYRCPDGQPFARKRMRYAGTPWAPDFELLDNRDGYVEGARLAQGQWQVYVQRDAKARRETADLPVRADTVVDAGFDDYVRSHWDTLTAGAPLPAAFLMPARLGYLNVKLAVLDPGMRGGVPVQRFRMSLDGWLGAIAPTVTLTYTQAGRRLLAFEGPSNVRDDHGKRQRVRIEFAERDAAPASADEIRAAGTEPLANRCPGA